MAKKSKILTFFTLLLLLPSLAGCTVLRNLSKSEYTKCFEKTSKDLVASQNTADLLYNSKKKMNKKQKQLLQEKVSKYATNTQKSLDTLEKYDTFTSYPSSVKSYCKLALDYENAVQKNESEKKLKKKYHKAAKQAIVVNQKAGFEKKTQKITKSVMLEDPHYTVKKVVKVDKNGKKTVVGSESKSKSKKKKKKKSNIPKSVISFSPVQGAVLILVSSLLIVVIFMQPSKSDDSMGALTATGGDSMFAKPKPRGYELFLIRSTQVLLLVLLGIIFSADKWKW